MRKDSLFTEQGTYEFVKRLGYKNIADAYREIPHHEFKRRRDKFLKNYRKQTFNNPTRRKDVKSKADYKDANQFLEDLALKIKRLIESIKISPRTSLNMACRECDVTILYIQNLRKLGYIQNSGSRMNPYWEVKKSINNYKEVASLVRDEVNSYINRKKLKNE